MQRSTYADAIPDVNNPKSVKSILVACQARLSQRKAVRAAYWDMWVSRCRQKR